MDDSETPSPAMQFTTTHQQSTMVKTPKIAKTPNKNHIPPHQLFLRKKRKIEVWK
ncbi:hypothetical protein [Granulicella sp. L60]|uniref:hypothetical protein n=1 Tax=Granulicella sp. L60 TaxID=1641866 RepID=UPI00131D4F9B|nr:hypothetical protein [Granulicella sp. L60]